MVIGFHTVQNRILHSLGPRSFARLSPYLRSMPLLRGAILSRPDEPIHQILFPETGFVSITSGDGRPVETGLIGREGLVGVPILLGSGQAPSCAVVRAEGHALSLDIEHWADVSEAVPDLAQAGRRFAHVLMVQAMQTAFANAVASLEPRLARWLLMCHDRLDGDELPITHECLGLMLGVQRTSVTLALQTLEGKGAVRSRRGRCIVRDRETLVDIAGPGYGQTEIEYRRLFPLVPLFDCTDDRTHATADRSASTINPAL